MKNQKQKSVVKKRGLYIALALALFVGAPVLGAILVQNFTQWDVVVEVPPIVKLQGVDANYDGDNDDTTGFLQVNLGQTISNNDDINGDGGTNVTNLAHEEITFTCFGGDRTYYTDVIQLQNTTTALWNVELIVEADLAGNAAFDDNFTTATGDADIWLFTSDQNSTGGLITEVPNPGLYGSLTEWYNATGVNDAIQLEVLNGVMSVANASSGSFTIPSGEQRQLGLVVDCSSDMTAANDSGTFRITVQSTP